LFAHAPTTTAALAPAPARKRSLMILPHQSATTDHAGCPRGFVAASPTVTGRHHCLHRRRLKQRATPLNCPQCPSHLCQTSSSVQTDGAHCTRRPSDRSKQLKIGTDSQRCTGLNKQQSREAESAVTASAVSLPACLECLASLLMSTLHVSA
jgi:hypothetical protein